ncbi:MAG: hypothetical protein MUE80_09010 [Acidobacteria bacterium]|nr:hypothetical protein [Acidobacteriota bacterium]
MVRVLAAMSSLTRATMATSCWRKNFSPLPVSPALRKGNSSSQLARVAASTPVIRLTSSSL